MKLIDRIMTEIQGRNLLGEIEYVCVNKETEKELLNNFQQEFAADIYEEMERDASREDLEDYFGLKVVIDNKIDKKEKYRLLSKAL